MSNVRTTDNAPVVDREPRCRYCNKKLGEALTRPWRIKCVRCKRRNASPE
jgi:phage FluMu protein Com